MILGVDCCRRLSRPIFCFSLSAWTRVGISLVAYCMLLFGSTLMDWEFISELAVVTICFLKWCLLSFGTSVFSNIFPNLPSTLCFDGFNSESSGKLVSTVSSMGKFFMFVTFFLVSISILVICFVVLCSFFVIITSFTVCLAVKSVFGFFRWLSTRFISCDDSGLGLAALCVWTLVLTSISHSLLNAKMELLFP